MDSSLGTTNLCTPSGVGLQTTTYFDKACTAWVEVNLNYSILNSNGISVGGGFQMIDTLTSTFKNYVITGNTSNGYNVIAHMTMPVAIPNSGTDTFYIRGGINANATISFSAGAEIKAQQLGN